MDVAPEEKTLAADIGHAVRVFRRARGWGIRHLALMSRVSLGTVCYVERGKQVPNVRTLVQIFQTLGLGVTLELRPRTVEDAAYFERGAEAGWYGQKAAVDEDEGDEVEETPDEESATLSA